MAPADSLRFANLALEFRDRPRYEIFAQMVKLFCGPVGAERPTLRRALTGSETGPFTHNGDTSAKVGSSMPASTERIP